MLDTGHPGELPLMKELIAIKRARSLHDPATVQSTVSGAPHSSLASSRKGRHFAGRNLEHEQPGGRGCLVGGQAGVGKVRAWRKGSTSKSTFQSGFLDDSDGQGSWDLGIEERVHKDARQQQEVFGGLRKQVAYTTSHGKLELQTRHGRELYNDGVMLRQWRSSGNAQDETRRCVERPNRGERRKKWADALTKGRVSAQNKETLKNQLHPRKKVSVKTQGKRSQSPSFSKQNPQVLSPLVLNSPEDFYYQSHHLPLFTLEGPMSNQELNQGLKLGTQGTLGSPSIAVRARSSLSMKPGAPRIWRSYDIPTSSSSTSQRSASQGSIPGIWWTPLNDELDVSELPTKGCGIPCDWSTSKKQGKTLLDSAGKSHSCSDLLTRKVLARDVSNGTPNRPAPSSKLGETEALPLLSELSADGGESSIEESERPSSDANGELGMDNGTAKKGPSSVASDVRDNADISVKGKELAVFVERPRNLSQKYRPKFFDELRGQNLVAHALSNAVSKGKIAPVYLFQGPRGTGKTSAARIFAAALNCASTGEKKPCGVCGKCIALASGKCPDVREVDAASHNGIEKVKVLLESLLSTTLVSRYNVFIIDECHMLTDETWNGLLKLLEEPPANAVLILITTDPGKLPRTAVSRCQKFHFQKFKHSDIVSRLETVVNLENLDVEPGALDLIASKSDGSLRDAETILDQLTLLGQNITLSTIHELVGSVSDEKLLSLLDLALCSDTVSTVRRARELIDSGVDPLDLMSQLATLITDILAGSCEYMSKGEKGGFFSRHDLSEEDLERLRSALRILSEAEKQLRAASNDRTTWLTAALLQFGPVRPLKIVLSSNSTSVTSSPAAHISFVQRQSRPKGLKTRKESRKRPTCKGVNASFDKGSMPMVKGNSRLKKATFEARVFPAFPQDAFKESSVGSSLTDSLPSNEGIGKFDNFLSPGNLGSIWSNVLQACKSIPVRQLLRSHAKLLSVSFSAVDAMVHVEFGKPEHKFRAERYRKSIASAFKKVLALSVEVKISLASLPAGEEGMVTRLCPSSDQTPTVKTFPQSSDFSRAEHEFQYEKDDIEVGSLRYWRSQNTGVALQNLAELTSSPYRYPAIPMNTGFSRTPNNSFAGGVQSSLNAPFSAEGKPVGGWVYAGRRESPLHAFDSEIFRASREFQAAARQQEIIEDMDLSASNFKQTADGLHAGNYVHGSSPKSYSVEEDNLSLESQWKYGGLLCWKAPNYEAKKASKQQRRRRFCVPIRLLPCRRTKRH